METEKDGAEKNLPVLLKKCPENFDSKILFEFFLQQQQNFREWVKYMLSFKKENDYKKADEKLKNLSEADYIKIIFNVFLRENPKLNNLPIIDNIKNIDFEVFKIKNEKENTEITILVRKVEKNFPMPKRHFLKIKEENENYDFFIYYSVSPIEI